MFETQRDLANLRRVLTSLCIAVGSAVSCLGLLVMLGWHIHSPRIVQILPTFAPMQYNTALCFLLCGIGLIFMAMEQWRGARVVGCVVATVGTLTLLQFVFQIDLGIDELLMTHDITTKTSQPGRMAPNSAICFVLTGLSIFLSPQRGSSPLRSLTAVLLASLALGLSTVAFSGYLTNLETAYGWGPWTRMALHTSLGLILISAALHVLIWSQGIRLQTGWLPHWLPIPVALAIITATFCFWQALAQAGARVVKLHPDLTGVGRIATIELVAGIVLAIAVALAAYLAQKSLTRARQLDKANLQMVEEIARRKEAERALQQNRDNLEIAVAERTRDLEIARREAEEASRAKSKFLSNMSHELRTPLNGILGYAQILKRHANLQDNQRRQIDAIANCGDHLLNLINDVLDLSKIEAQRVEVDMAPLDLHALIEGVVDIVREKAAQKGLNLQIEINTEVPIGITTDGAKLRQMLINLLGNAVKFTDRGGITLRVSRPTSDHLNFAVADTGVGMSEAELSAIYDPFKQMAAGKAAGGTGLGLAICKNLAELLDAEIRVNSELGKGSTFTISLPLMAVPPDWSATTKTDQTDLTDVVLAEGQSITILVADDRDTNREVLAGLLTPIGFHVRIATDGDEAIDLLRQHTDIALTLLDLRMPRVSGLEAIRIIRNDPVLKSTPVIAVTASAFPEYRRQAIAAGFNDFLSKPVRIDQLLATLKKHLAVTFVPCAGHSESSTTRPSDVTPSTAAPASSKHELNRDQLSRLREALRIKNITAILDVARQLESTSERASLGRQIQSLARRFDFETMSAMLEQWETSHDVK